MAAVRRNQRAPAAPEPKWRRRADERPDEILDAALEIFDDCGFDAARVEDVARRAGISKAGLYLYFDSKEALLRALIEREVAPFARTIRALAEAGTGDPLGTLGGIIAAMMHLLQNPRRFAVPRIVLGVAGRFPEIGAFYRERVFDEALAAFVLLYEAGVERGLFRPLDPVAAARAVMGPIMIEALWSHVFGGGPDARDVNERARAHLDLLMHGLAAP